MKRKGIHKPTIEDIVEISGIETLHPGGFPLSKRIAEIANMKKGLKVLDVSSGRGTQAILYAKEYDVSVTGLDISKEMILAARQNAEKSGVSNKVTFVKGDSQALPFDDDSFDIVINECAVGIPDDSQQVLKEMVRVAKPGGTIVIHESTWIKKIGKQEKSDISERYGTTPLEYEEWLDLLHKAGVKNIVSELEEWSNPEMFWEIRKERTVKDYTKVLSPVEQLITMKRLISEYGFKAVLKAFENRKKFYNAVIDGKLGYCLYKGTK